MAGAGVTLCGLQALRRRLWRTAAPLRREGAAGALALMVQGEACTCAEGALAAAPMQRPCPDPCLILP